MARTVTTNALELVDVPSLTVMVIVADPERFGAAVTITVRLLPLPPNTILARGIRLVFDEAAVRVKLAAGVVESDTVKAMLVVAESSFMVWFGIEEIVGAPST